MFCTLALRSGLAAGLVFEKRQTGTKADKLFEDEGNKCSWIVFRPLEQKYNSDKKLMFLSSASLAANPMLAACTVYHQMGYLTDMQ